MTTGRINQVTIVPRASEEGRDLGEPRENCTLIRVRTPSVQDPGARLQQGPLRYPIAPTEFPTGRSVALAFQGEAPSNRVTYTPQEEDTVCQSRPRAATDFSLPPNVLEQV
jgi:hypothetical protein